MRVVRWREVARSRLVSVLSNGEERSSIFEERGALARSGGENNMSSSGPVDSEVSGTRL